MKELVFVLEEESAEYMLQGFLPKILPQDVSYAFITLGGKQRMENRLPLKLKKYLSPYARFIIMRDQDYGDCHIIKEKLQKICQRNTDKPSMVRVACRELESWYLAQLEAVEKGLGLTNLVRLQKNYQHPDAVGSPSKKLEDITKGEYSKTAGSRAIGPHLDPDCERSTSFKHFVAAVRRLAH